MLTANLFNPQSDRNPAKLTVSIDFMNSALTKPLIGVRSHAILENL